MEQMEQLLGHALVRVEAVEKLHDRHEAETKSLMHEWRAEARVAAQLIQALQAQVVQLTSRVSTLDEALLAERRRNEQLSQERAERLRAQAEASENALREQFRALSARVEAQVDKGEKALREYASQLRAQADASEGVLRQEIARLRSEAAVSLSAASPNSSRPPTVAELGLQMEALKQNPFL
jgi:tellurite resistance protein